MHKYELHLLDDGPKDAEYTKEQAASACRTMLRIRHMEMILSDLYKEGQIRGFCHLAIGQEAISAGIELALGPEDVLITSYRCHSFALVSGLDAKEIVCEQVGSVEGCSRGKGGSMHLYGRNFLGGHGIVGAQISLGLGAAFAEKYRSVLESPLGKRPAETTQVVGEWTNRVWETFSCKNVTVAAFGDGAANQGQLYESLNMAALWKLPIIFLCENNEYGMGTPISRSSASTRIYNRFSFVPGILLDSTDAFAVASVFKYAREHALTKGPIIVECATYRYNGHSMTDAFTGYRTPEEVNAHKGRDSVECIKKYMGDDADAAVQELAEAARSEMEKIKAVAAQSPRCSLSDLATDILA
ncbi:pyruvate dehydrogenase E1 component alpha subunit [Nematocida major]|uniref:pyruvate dehydrogenase E1 component alpha subunit n=1 Tax=Nematocida major TaxID=1912982 RepID=UPI002007EC78|nr:pyruvate dehydrogenase E1 component alpha subunit [Nematocida major]KAH9385466.1 pyruvate dehydrogenase E1 component alpha subunit [Nematocida major]